MDKQLHQTLTQVPMFSKMGKYISNKILKYNKRANTQRNFKKTPPPNNYQISPKKTRDTSPANSSKHSLTNSRIEIMAGTQPPVGFYKVNYSQIDKNARTYNFERSVPHFNRDKYFCNESNHYYRDMPDSSLCQQKIKGFTELCRMTAREDIKGSIRKNIQDPHENRFKMHKDYKAVQYAGTRVNMSKDLARNNILFKSMEHSPDYEYEVNSIHKRLDTHILPFEKIIPRGNKALNCSTGISDCFGQYELKDATNSPSWKKMLPRSKTGLLPSYMDKNINTRSNLNLLNLKTLEMNCTDIKKPAQKKKKMKRKIMFVEEEESKENKFFN